MSRIRRMTTSLTATAAGCALIVTGLSGQTNSAAAAPAPPPSGGATAADSRIGTMLNRRWSSGTFGNAFSGAVIDAGSNRLIWGHNNAASRMPASNNKLVTAANALTALGPDKRFGTWVRTGQFADQAVLVGGGDPTLSSSQLNAMAQKTAADFKAKGRTSARTYADDTLFPAPSLAVGWDSDLVPRDATPIRALVRDQRNLNDTTADAATYFAARLTAYGVKSSYVGRAKAPAASTVITSSAGLRLDQIINRTLLNSDNDIAEILFRQVGRALGYGATWTAGTKAAKAQMNRLGLATTAVYDGSGLSRSDRMSAIQLARLIDRAFDTSQQWNLAPLRSPDAMPTAGRTGTLANRFSTAQSSCAAGKVYAKTGTLNDATALSGWTVGTDGRIKIFSFLVNGRADSTARNGLDMLAATVNGCY